MTVESLMTRKVVSVDPECSIADVLNKLRAYRISCLVVCEEDVPVGIISERDIVGVAFNCVSGKGEARGSARELMSPSPVTVRVDESLDDTLAITEEHRIRHLPVVDGNGRLAGIVTQTDLLRACLDATNRTG